MRKMTILMVEDNEVDVELLREALAEAEMPTNLYIAEDGIEAIAFLQKEGKYSEAVRPDLILLDLNLPRMSGHEVLQEIKNNPEYKSIPVVVLSTSNIDRDIQKAYNNGVNSFITKPMSFDQFIKVAKSIRNFWFDTAQIPER